MSQISITGASTGTATFTIESPATSTNRTITLADATGTMVVSGTTPSLNGIAFPATQSASADANTLDDYEEGTWSPVIEGSTITGTASYSNQSGWYTKVGNIVTVGFYVDFSSATGTGSLRIAGLPFSSASGNFVTGSIMNSSYDWNAGTMITLYKPPNSSYFEIYASADNAGWVQQPMDTAAEFIGGCTYRV
jgi:hypothetical protein